jgi:hypothetical protein
MLPVLPVESLLDAFELVCYFGTLLAAVFSALVLKRT